MMFAPRHHLYFLHVAVPTAEVTITIRMPWCVAVTGSCLWTSTSLGARPLLKLCSMGSCSCRRRSPGQSPSRCGTGNRTW